MEKQISERWVQMVIKEDGPWRMFWECQELHAITSCAAAANCVLQHPSLAPEFIEILKWICILLLEVISMVATMQWLPAWGVRCEASPWG